VSENSEVTEAHRAFVGDFNYHAMVGKGLSGARRRLGISEVAKNHRGRGSLWRKRDDRVEGSSAPIDSSLDESLTSRARPVRDGHWRSVLAMEGADFRQIVRLFETRDAIGGAYSQRAVGAEPLLQRLPPGDEHIAQHEGSREFPVGPVLGRYPVCA